MTTHAAAVSKARPGLTVKQYKPLLSSALANSILNAQQFHYTNSANTDIRKTFANFRRNASRQPPASVATNVRTLRTNPIDAAPAPCSLESLRRSSADRRDTTLRKGNDMLTRFIQWLGLWMSVYLLTAATGSVVMAEVFVRAEEGKVVAIELYRTLRQQARQRRNRDRRHRRWRDRPPDRKRSRKHGGNHCRRTRRRAGRKRNREEADAGDAIPHHRATRFRQLADGRRPARPQPAGGRPRVGRGRPHPSDLGTGSCR